MALIVEDGTGKVDSQTYATEAELATYATDRGLTLSGVDSELLLKATDYLETLSFIGSRLTKEQALQWPRSNVSIDAFDYDSDEIPALLKTAQMAVAVAIDEGNDPMSPIEREVKSEAVDGIRVEYMDSAAPFTITPAVSRILDKLVKGGGIGSPSLRVVRV
jgi:hypothetical protein